MRPHLKRRRPKEEAAVIGALQEIDELANDLYDWRDDHGVRYVDSATIGVFGGYGAGKTTLAQILFNATCLRNRRTDIYKGDFPRAYLLAPTGPCLQDTSIHRFEAMMPSSVIDSRTKSPYVVTLTNGCKIFGKSADATNEGFEGCALNLEEVDKPEYWRNPALMPNLMGRIRDPFSPFRRIIASGLPAAGHVRKQFDRAVNRVFLLASSDNPAIDEATMDQIRQSCPAGQEESLLRGQWMQPPGAVFLNFDTAKHLVPQRWFDPKEPIHMAMDVGNHGYYCKFQRRKVMVKGITGQKTPGLGVLFLCQRVILGQSVEDLMIASKTDDYPVTHKVGVIAMDPTVRAEERKMVQRYYPGHTIVQREKTDPYYHVEEGIRLMQAALGDSLGNTRLWFLESMGNDKDGAVEALLVAKRNEKSGELIKDDRTDHARDGVRYGTCYALAKRSGPEVLK
jgi:hypothetical protein